jgi:hypothetical protein
MDRTVTRERHDAAAEEAGPGAPTGSVADATCALCAGRVDGGEAVPVRVDGVDGVDGGALCPYCASSLFDDADRADRTGTGGTGARGGTRPGRDAPVAPADGDGGGAAAVRWRPASAATDATGSGVLGTLVRGHYLSLSLLWAIHRTNVRLTERLIEEVDVQQLLVLAVVCSTLVWVAAVTPLGG